MPNPNRRQTNDDKIADARQKANEAIEPLPKDIPQTRYPDQKDK